MYFLFYSLEFELFLDERGWLGQYNYLYHAFVVIQGLVVVLLQTRLTAKLMMNLQLSLVSQKLLTVLQPWVTYCFLLCLAQDNQHLWKVSSPVINQQETCMPPWTELQSP